MAATEIDPLPAGVTAGRPAQRTEVGLVTELRQGDGGFTLPLSQDSFREMSVRTGSYDFSDPCDDLDDEEMDSDGGDSYDPVFEEIKKSLRKREEDAERNSQADSLCSAGTSEEDGSFTNISEKYTNVSYGIQPRDAYKHGKKSADIMGVTYNGRMRQFILLDSKGIVSWKRDAVDNRVTRILTYPRHQYRLITYLVYASKFNCYFALWKDFSLRVLNRDFVETCSISADLNSVLFMLFNPVRDELITGGVGGTKVYHFHQAAGKMVTEIKPLANYELTLRYELPNVGGSMVKKVDLDYHMEHLYCCSDTDLHVYSLEGKQLYQFNRAHRMSITGCRYSVAAKVLVTSSIDTEVKVWSMTGGLVHTFRGHSRAVTNLLIHPHNSTIVLTSSLDGTLRMWSLDTMEALYSLVVSSSGLLWMGLTDDNLLYISTARSLTLWHLNHFIHFWSLTRNQVTRLMLEGCSGKTQRVMAVGEDSSIRLFARSNQKNLSTVLPPPSISPLQQLLGVCYSREFNVIFVLINPKLIWVYTTRTDPACRIAVWDVHQIQTMSLKSETRTEERTLLQSSRPGTSHRATESGIGNELPCDCLCVCILKSSAMLWTEEGCCCPVRHSYLLLGMEDGRVLFMDPVVKGQKFMEFKVSKDPVVELHHDMDHQCLVTVSRMKELTCIQFWSLPDLELLHEVYCLSDLTAYARIGYTCVTAHESGHILFHTLEIATDPGFYKGRMVPEMEDMAVTRRPEHLASVITVDACASMKIFCSCSKDGVIKVWEEGGVLMTEITLDDTLSAACFLNKSADLIVAFQKQIFFISHSKVCPHLEPAEPEDHSFDKESYVYEDPAVVHEGFMIDPDPMDLEKYLVPYEIEFSKDFLEGKVTLEPSVAETEDSDEEGSTLSFAPTEVYQSRPSTPDSLTMVDLTLRSEITKYDLLQQMKSTLQILTAREEGLELDAETEETLQAILERQKRKHRRRQGASLSPEEAAKMAAAVEKGEAGTEESKAEEEASGKDKLQFEFPKFEGSPGPTPTLTPSSTPAPVSEAELSEEEEETESDIEDQLPPKKFPDLGLVVETQTKLEKAVGKTKTPKEDLPAPKRSRQNIADVEIDVQSLMKTRRAAPMAKEADHSHVKREGPTSSFEHTEDLTPTAETTQDSSRRTLVKKKTVAQRKLPKRGSRSSQAPDGEREGKDKAIMSVLGKTGAGLDENQSPLPKQTKGSSESDSQKESEDEAKLSSVSEMISVDIKTVVPPATTKPDAAVDDDPGIEAELPPLPPTPDIPERPLSSKSHSSVKSASRRHPIEFLRQRSRAEVGMSPTAELESNHGRATPATDTALLSRTQTPSALSELGENRSLSVLSRVSSREGDGQYLNAEEELDLSMDEVFFSQTRSVSPASSVFTFRPRDSPLRGEIKLSALLDSRHSGADAEDWLEFVNRPVPPVGTQLSGRSSALSSKTTSHKTGSYRPTSAVSRTRPSSSVSLKKRPKSAVSYRSQKNKHDGSKFHRSDSRDLRTAVASSSSLRSRHHTVRPDCKMNDATAMAEQLLLQLSGQPTPGGNTGPSQVGPMLSGNASEYTLDSDKEIMIESPRVEIRYKSGSYRGSTKSSARSESREESLCKRMGLPPSVCPPSCVCQLPPAERDAALKRKKRISFGANQWSGGDSRLQQDEAHQNASVDYSRQSSVPSTPSQGALKDTRHLSLGSDAVFEEFDLERGQGQNEASGLSPRPPPSPRLPSSPRQRFSSAGSSRNVMMSSSMSHLEATGRESVMSGVGHPPSIADSFSERLGTPDSCLPDGELASISMRESPGTADEDEHRAWSRIGLPDPTLMADVQRPSSTLLPARHGEFQGFLKRRPFTAAHTSFQDEELRAVFEAALHRYQKVHGAPGQNEPLYNNKGVDFEGKWHEKVLERHMLLRMQRVLRAHSAKQKRQMIQEQRIKSASMKDSSATQQAQKLLSRPSTANPAVLRPEVTTPAPAPSPAPSRPHTAAAEDQVPSMNQQKQMCQEKRQQLVAQKERQQLGDERPFRLRMREPAGDSPPQSPRYHPVQIDPWLLDPRNPAAVRPPSSKSIPSKCSRYVLLSRPRTVADMPMPTPLEEELLATRFPDQSLRLLQSAGAAMRPTPPQTNYSMSYSPFTTYG